MGLNQFGVSVSTHSIPGPISKARAGGQGLQQFTGHQAERADRGPEFRLGAEPLHKDPGEDIEGDERDRRPGREEMRIFVTDREHRPLRTLSAEY